MPVSFTAHTAYSRPLRIHATPSLSVRPGLSSRSRGVAARSGDPILGSCARDQPRLSDAVGALSSWLQEECSDQASKARFTISTSGLGGLIFKGLAEQHGVPEQGLPVLASVLASLCGISPVEHRDQLEAFVSQYLGSGDTPWPANNAWIDLASLLLGQDYELHATQGSGVMASMQRSRAWLVIRPDGTLWYGNKVLTGAGALMLQQRAPSLPRQRRFADDALPQYCLSWDHGLLECSRVLMDKPTVTMVWPDRYVTGITPPASQQPVTVSDPCIQLLSNPAYQFVHALPLPAELGPARSVVFKERLTSDPVQSVGSEPKGIQQRSVLLAQPQLWLAAHRLARLCPSSSVCDGPAVREDALISLLHGSATLCPLQLRVAQVLLSQDPASRLKEASLQWYPHGAELMQELSCLLGASDWTGQVVGPNKPMASLLPTVQRFPVEGALRLWITPRGEVSHGVTHDLNVYAQGPSFGHAPLHMQQELSITHGKNAFKTGNLTVTRGVEPLEHTDDEPSIYLLMSPEIDDESLDAFEARALSQAPLWANLIEMNRAT